MEKTSRREFLRNWVVTGLIPRPEPGRLVRVFQRHHRVDWVDDHWYWHCFGDRQVLAFLVREVMDWLTHGPVWEQKPELVKIYQGLVQECTEHGSVYLRQDWGDSRWLDYDILVGCGGQIGIELERP